MKKRRNLLYVIGIDRYGSGDFDDLNNAVADAKALINILVERYGFELLPDPLFDKDATRENIYQGFNRLMLEAEKDDNVLIFFTGHGRMHAVGGQGYWVPHEAKNRIGDFIENSVIKDFIERIPAQHIFLIADSCFSGTFLTRTRSGGNVKEYSLLDEALSRWMLASGSEEPVSDGKPGEHSPFAGYLIKFLESNDNKYTSAFELIRYVSTMTEHNSKQHPIGAQIDNIGHAGGQMIFTLSDRFVKSTNEKSFAIPHTRILHDDLKAYEKKENRLPSGKEILLIESFLKEGEVMVIELFRFDEAGNKKLHFEDGVLKMTDKKEEKSEWKVIRRFATLTGFTRYLDEHEAEIKSKNPIVLHADESINEVEETDAAVYYSYWMQDMFDHNPDTFSCLHCGDVINNEDCLMVEIDEKGLKPAVGHVHNGCLRPLDRIIGKPVFPEGSVRSLDSFDSEKWIELLKRGQFHWLNALSVPNQPIWTMTWNQQHIINKGDYCVKCLLDDGTIKYVRLGREVHRYPASKIDEELDFLVNSWKESEDAGNPVGYTSKYHMFGPTSELEKRKQADETILQIVSMEKVKYSKQLEAEHNTHDNDYAPVGLVVIPGSNELVSFGNCIPLIMDPTKFDDLHKNWNEAGYYIGPCAIQIIETDKEFGLYLMSWLAQGMQPIVHPMFDKDKELLSGTFIQDIRYFTDGAESQSYQYKENPDWRTGDRVKVIFPEAKGDRVPEGVLLSDEFIDETGESCAIFRPVENGKELEDMSFKMPVRLFEKFN